MDINQRSLALHKKLKGKIEIKLKHPLTSMDDLNLLYTPGVAAPCIDIHKKKNIREYTMKQNSVAVITDGSAVLGLGNIGPEAALPVMEGKAAIFKSFAGIDAFPICLDTQDTEEIIKTIKYISPVFGGINLEDISAPRCFEIEKRLQDIGIPVIHDDQHGTVIAVIAGLINACKVVKKNLKELTVVICGAGAAGTAIAKALVNNIKVKDVIVCDREGIINKNENYAPHKKFLAGITNKKNIRGSLKEAFKGADVFIGVSGPNLVTKDMIQTMARDPIVFSLANPTPEIMPAQAKEGGAKVIATGRSDFPNQINNALVFPGLFRGALDAGLTKVTDEMKIKAAYALASIIKKPTADKIIPDVFNKDVVKNIAKAIK